MNYVLIKNTDLAEIVPLRCSYKADLDLQIAIQSIGLGSLNSKQTHFVNYDASLISPQLEKVLGQFIDEIDFASLQRILSHPRLKELIRPELLLGHYQIPSTVHVHTILERSLAWSDSTLYWLMLKKIKPHEVSFLNLLSADECATLVSTASNSNLSKMDVLKLLEITSELMLMKIDVTGVLQSSWTEATLTHVKNLRYPLSFTYNPINQVHLKWPKTVSTQAKRIQDKMGFQVQFFVSHPDELNQTLAQLEKMIPDWTNELEGLSS